jgi:hypothetical protein
LRFSGNGIGRDTIEASGSDLVLRRCYCEHSGVGLTSLSVTTILQPVIEPSPAMTRALPTEAHQVDGTRTWFRQSFEAALFAR